ncbi:MAG: hypothetical protein LV473_16055 [Nitrospira sp.]|nr:hypothetical protein [Nitrospira sp.]
MDESLKVFAKQLGKNAEKQPGWIYLLATIYFVLQAFGVPTQVDIAGLRLTVPKLSAEIWATLLTLVLYQVGDALDKVTFKKRDEKGNWVDRFQPESLKDAIAAARAKFGVKDGIYDVSMKILEKAKQAKFSVHFLNEMAKFFRSLIAPVLAVAIVLSLKLTMPWALLLVAVALLCAYVLAVHVYPRLKNLHRINLYKEVVALPAEDQAKVSCQELGTVRMFFWQGALIATAPKPTNPMLNTDAQQARSATPSRVG